MITITTALKEDVKIVVGQDLELYALIDLNAAVKLDEFEQIMEIIKISKDGEFKTTLEKIGEKAKQ